MALRGNVRMVALALALGVAIVAGAMIAGFQPWNTVSTAEAAASAISHTSDSLTAAQSSTNEVGNVLTANAGDEPDGWASKIVNVIQGESSEPPASSDSAETTAEPEYKVQIDALYERWEPAYEQAMSDLENFDESFAQAIERVGEYLVEQRELTESISDSILRAEQDRHDRIEREAVQRWIENGAALSLEVANVKRELEDVHAILTKLSLRGAFLAENSALYQIPESALQLHSSLGSFKAESDELAAQLQETIFSQ